METRHSLQSNPVPTSFFVPRGIKINKKDVVGTGLDCRLCLVSIMFADLPSLHPLHFIEMIFILVQVLELNFC